MKLPHLMNYFKHSIAINPVELDDVVAEPILEEEIQDQTEPVQEEEKQEQPEPVIGKRKGRPRTAQREQYDADDINNCIRDIALIDLCMIINMKPVAPDVKITRSKLDQMTKPEMIELIFKKFEGIEELRRKNAITYCENNGIFAKLQIN